MNSYVIGYPTGAPTKTSTNNQCAFSNTFTTLRAEGLETHLAGADVALLGVDSAGVITKNSSSGLIPASTLAAKGDLLTSDGSGVVALPPGTNGQILIANSSAADGISWSSKIPDDITALQGNVDAIGLIAFSGGWSGILPIMAEYWSWAYNPVTKRYAVYYTFSGTTNVTTTSFNWTINRFPGASAGFKSIPVCNYSLITPEASGSAPTIIGGGIFSFTTALLSSVGTTTTLTFSSSVPSGTNLTVSCWAVYNG